MYPFLSAPFDQKWSIFYMGNGSTSVYIIQSQGKNLTTSSTSGVVGSLSMANPTNNNNQLFTLTASGSGYKIQDYFGFYITSSSPSTLHASTFAEWQFFKCSNTLYKSINGICWGQGISNPLGTFVAVGDGNYPIMYSRDGFNWNGVTILEKSSSSILVSANVTGATAAYRSTNGGTTWTTLTGFPITTEIKSMYYVPEKIMYIACGNGTNSVAFSYYDGSTWTGSTSATSLSTANCVCYSPALDLFVVGGNGGFLWARGATFVFTYVSSSVNFNSICWSPELLLFVAATSSGIYYSTTGLTFTYIYSSGVAFTSVIKAGSLFLTTALNMYSYSYNGINWTLGDTDTNFTTDNTVAFNGYIYIRCKAGVLSYSYDGLQYISTAWNNYKSIYWSGSYFMAFNSADGYIYSIDGIRWYTKAATPNIKTLASNSNLSAFYPFCKGIKVCWNGTQFFACGGQIYSSDSSFYFATSKDGIIWTVINNTGFAYINDVSTVSNVEQVNQNTQLILDKYGTEETQQLDIISDEYFQQGINNFNITIQHNTLK